MGRVVLKDNAHVSQLLFVVLTFLLLGIMELYLTDKFQRLGTWKVW